MLDINDIQSILQHRYPFLLVDRVLEIEPGRRAVGLKNVTVNEAYFNGHFPGKPIMPGVLIVEAMAQVGGILLLASSHNEGKLALFGGMDKVRFRKPVVPGDQLITEVTIERCRGDIGKVRVEGRVDDQVVAEGEYLFVLIKQEDAQRHQMVGAQSEE
jgi:3-hydroxyacyl-[acyl-carrier-protein] dehydratase